MIICQLVSRCRNRVITSRSRAGFLDSQRRGKVTVTTVRPVKFSIVQTDLFVVNFLVPLQVTLVTRRVVAQFTHVIFLSAVHGDVPLQQSLPAEVAPAVATHVAAAVEDDDVVSQRRLVLEGNAATLKSLLAGLMHCRHVTLQVVLSVRHVAAL